MAKRKCYFWPTFYCFLRFGICTSMHSQSTGENDKSSILCTAVFLQLNKYFYDLNTLNPFAESCEMPTGPPVIVGEYWKWDFNLLANRNLFFMYFSLNFDGNLLYKVLRHIPMNIHFSKLIIHYTIQWSKLSAKFNLLIVVQDLCNQVSMNENYRFCLLGELFVGYDQFVWIYSRKFIENVRYDGAWYFQLLVNVGKIFREKRKLDFMDFNKSMDHIWETS